MHGTCKFSANMIKWECYTVTSPFWAAVSPSPRYLLQHIFDEDAVPRGGVVDEDMGDGSDQLAILHDGRAAHECVQVRTTVFNGKLIKLS